MEVYRQTGKISEKHRSKKPLSPCNGASSNTRHTRKMGRIHLFHSTLAFIISEFYIMSRFFPKIFLLKYHIFCRRGDFTQKPPSDFSQITHNPIMSFQSGVKQKIHRSCQQRIHPSVDNLGAITEALAHLLGTVSILNL